MFILKLILKVICIPIIVISSIVKYAALAVIGCGAHLMSPVMLFCLFGIVYTVCRQQWNQTAIFVLMEIACGFLLFATTAIAVFADDIRDSLTGFVRG